MQEKNDQLRIFEYIFSDRNNWSDLSNSDPFVRYVSDRRLELMLKSLQAKYSLAEMQQWKVLIVCGGAGMEAMFFKAKGFKNVTNSDFSANALKITSSYDVDIETMVLNAEAIDLPDNSFDLVIVRDGLHHLPRPVLGFNELIRVASKIAIVIEPYQSLAGSLMGKEWEVLGDATNFVFRWNRELVRQVVNSQLLKNYQSLKVLRLWDHHETMEKIGAKVPISIRLGLAKLIYGILGLFNFCGNMMIAILYKQKP